MNQKTRIRKAISRLDSSERHLVWVLNRRRGQKKLSKNTDWNIRTAIFDLKNARTFLKNSLDESKNDKEELIDDFCVKLKAKIKEVEGDKNGNK